MDDILNDAEALVFLENICPTCPVISGALDSFKNEELQEKAIELIIEIISMIPHNSS